MARQVLKPVQYDARSSGLGLAQLLEVVAADAEALTGSVRGTADLAERVSRKVPVTAVFHAP